MTTPSAAPSALDAITVASPCTVDWDTMTGDERSRHCGECKLDVYDLSAMSRAEAESFLASRVPGARLCVRFARRPDGRVVTDDCVTARQRIARRARRIHAAASALFALVLPALSACSGDAPSPPTPSPIMGKIAAPAADPAPVVPQDDEPRLMGEACVVEPAPAPDPAKAPDPTPAK